jgi:hypothetical protein
MSYVPLEQARFTIEPTLEGEVLTIPAVRNIFIMLFMSFWLTMWTIGGIAAMGTLMLRFELFLVFWLMAWALGWLAASSTLAWMFAGKQVLRVVDQDLEVGLKILGFERRKVYQGREVRQIGVAPVTDWPMRRGPQLPFGVFGATGAVQFTYGARTRFLAAGMDQAEAGQIVDWLKKRLPGDE